ncbi:MAG: DUF2459 domain-containing protein [Candidatus Binatia bacterium]
MHIVILIALLAFACARPIDQLYPAGEAEKTRTVFVVNLGWHTGIVLSKADIPQAILPEVRDFPDAEFLKIGWGDWDYYQDPDPGLGMALKAAFWSSRSVLHVVGFKVPVEDQFRGIEFVEIPLSAEGLERLRRFVAETFMRSEVGQPAEPSPGLYPNSRFYPARGKFHIFRTCNTWVAEALHTAGLPITPFYAITAGNLMYQVQQAGTIRTPSQ